MRTPKPSYRKQNKTWYAEIGGTQTNLGKDKRLATEEFRKLRADYRPGAVTSPQRSPRRSSLLGLAETERCGVDLHPPPPDSRIVLQIRSVWIEGDRTLASPRRTLA